MPGDPPPNPKYRWIFPIVLLLFICGLLAPLAVVYYHNAAIEQNQNAAIDAMRNYASLQREFFKREQRYASSFAELGDPEWGQVREASLPSPTNYHGYRFRLFTSTADMGGSRINFVDSAGHMT